MSWALPAFLALQFLFCLLSFPKCAAATADATSLPVLTQMSPAETSSSDSLLPWDEDPLLQGTTLASLRMSPWVSLVGRE